MFSLWFYDVIVSVSHVLECMSFGWNCQWSESLLIGVDIILPLYFLCSLVLCFSWLPYPLFFLALMYSIIFVSVMSSIPSMLALMSSVIPCCHVVWWFFPACSPILCLSLLSCSLYFRAPLHVLCCSVLSCILGISFSLCPLVFSAPLSSGLLSSPVLMVFLSHLSSGLLTSTVPWSSLQSLHSSLLPSLALWSSGLPLGILFYPQRWCSLSSGQFY